ncbi:hypothetical protein RE474_05715 [Methanolobus sediminis]|uniref:Uncharacterized protein n=1 Tax=Methanolobus sediminis TaxID=3072978 RepID=A0AA51UNB4_9EURY|nr:hypothetical protein [Methanolobus sediminis]WMW26208.1 hypothetical protein RE474_05715 [Methanolobus sediminis]
MTIRSLREDDSAVSITVGFILTFSITVIILVTILSSFYSLMNTAEQTVMREEFEIHANDIAVRIATIDTMIGTASHSGSEVDELKYEISLPERIAGKTYSIEFDNSTKDIVFISQDRKETRIKVPYYTENTIVYSTTLQSSKGEYTIEYDPDINAMIIS